AKAGLRVGDVITAVNGNAVKKVDEVRKFIDASNPKVGTQINLTIVRNYRLFETTLTIERARR
ncbi:PDZ domain-containing protein, partial [candidate division KSB1 bacterium]|nr:PDZ domain-containing protein [candidate division KSB1 bacterium]